MTNVRYIGTQRRKEIVERQKWLCAICGEKLEPNRFEIDHIQAVENGGDAADDNLRALHPRCHRQKTNKDIAGIRKRDRLRYGKAKKGRPFPKRINAWNRDFYAPLEQPKQEDRK